MATWGAYIASYVRQNDAKRLTKVEEPSEKPSPFKIKPYSGGRKIDDFRSLNGTKSSSNKTHDLYSGLPEPASNLYEVPQRSKSNADRMAKLFGYEGCAPIPQPASAFAGGISKALEATEVDRKSVEEIKPVTVNPPIQNDIKPVTARKDSKFDEGSGTPSLWRESLIDAKVDIWSSETGLTGVKAQSTMPEQQMNQVDSSLNKSTHDLTKTSGVAPQPKLTPKPGTSARSDQSNPIAQWEENPVGAGKPSISSLDDLMMDLLKNNEKHNTSNAQASSTLADKKLRRESNGRGKRVKEMNTSLSSLDEMIASLEIEISASHDPSNLATTEEETVRAHVRKMSKTEKTSVSNLDETVSPGEQGWKVGMWDQKASGSDPKSTRPPPKLTVSTREVSQTRVDVGAYSSSYGDDLVTSPESYASYRGQQFLDKTNDQIHKDEGDSTEKPLIEYMKEAEEMRFERERIEMERRRILEEEVAFQREADKFALEEEQMRRFVENLRIEQERDSKNQERKRRITEGKIMLEEGERERKEEEARRVREREAERLAIKVAEQLNQINERIERERRDRGARLFQRRADEERMRYVEEEGQLKAKRIEDERIGREQEEKEERSRKEQRIARSKAEHLEEKENDELRRQVEKERANRTIFEVGEKRRVEGEKVSRDYWRTVRENATRLRREKEEVQQVLRPRKSERITRAQHTNRERLPRMGHAAEQGALDVERIVAVGIERLTHKNDLSRTEASKEQKMQKAEEKIKVAFAELAQERDAISIGNKPAFDGLINVGLEISGQERGVSRYNTIGAGPRLRQGQALGVSRVNSVGMKPKESIEGGLPSGPKGGFGLPGRPNAGLPSGPRPRRNL